MYIIYAGRPANFSEWPWRRTMRSSNDNDWPGGSTSISLPEPRIGEMAAGGALPQPQTIAFAAKQK